ncbi:hypothetical protein C5F48_14150 [Cereibacter changlensis JA139]|uniref:IclR-ED domain-containing protein n=2 Tax=Cereibacter changlensis TaxID=402884 RepID=A0A2T4JT33_9RHOB|nr:hypothetical protein C5F48_14150 [Cereibacter changlensis JA139]
MPHQPQQGPADRRFDPQRLGLSDDDAQRPLRRNLRGGRGGSRPDPKPGLLDQQRRGIGAVAVPILDDEGAMPLTLSIFGMQHRFDSAMLVRALPMLRQTAANITQTLTR